MKKQLIVSTLTSLWKHNRLKSVVCESRQISLYLATYFKRNQMADNPTSGRHLQLSAEKLRKRGRNSDLICLSPAFLSLCEDLNTSSMRTKTSLVIPLQTKRRKDVTKIQLNWELNWTEVYWRNKKEKRKTNKKIKNKSRLK